MISVPETTRVSSSADIAKLTTAISKCCESIADVLSTTFDQVSGFAQGMWTAISNADLLVDIVVRKLVLLEKHIGDLAKAITSGITSFAAEEIIPFLYEVEEFLVHHMQNNAFFAQTFGWLVKGILYFIHHLKGNVVVCSVE